MGAESAAAAFVLCLLPILTGLSWLVASGPVDVTRPSAWLALALGGGGWLAALALASRVRDSWALLVVLASGALALRLVAIASTPALSDDLHRYVFEGALVLEGVDPYSAAPAAPERAEFQQRWRSTFERVNHPEVPAAYPPFAQSVHAALVWVAGGAERPERCAAVLRAFQGWCDLALCLPLAWLLRRHARPLAWLAVWAWNPWLALEFAGAGHLDALAILATVAALACFPTGSGVRASKAAPALGLLAAGTATKLLPVLLLPFLLRRLRRPFVGALLFGLSLALCCAPLVLWTGALPGSAGLGEYAFRWESFSLLYRWIEPPFAQLFARDEQWSDPRRLGRALALGLFLVLAARAWGKRLEPVRAGLWLMGGFLLLTPTLHPWYLPWIVPFLALRPQVSWCALLAVAPLFYWPLAQWRTQATWLEPAWLWPAVAGPFLLLLLLEGLRARRLERR